MKMLKELIDLVTLHRQKKIDIFQLHDLDKKTNNPYESYFQHVKNSKWQTDEDAARALYKTSPDDKKYLMFKSRFKQKLLNNFFFIDAKTLHLSQYTAAEIESNKKLVLAQILLPLGARTSAVNLAHKGLKMATDFELTKQAIGLSSILIKHYGQTGDIKSLAAFKKINEEQVEILQAELRAENFISYIICFFSSSTSVKPSLLEEVDAFLKKLEEDKLRDNVKTFHFIINCLTVKLYRCEIAQDFIGSIKVCEEIEEEVNGSPRFYTPKQIAEYGIAKMNAYMHLRDYAQGSIVADKYFKIADAHAPYWFIVSEYYFLFLMKVERFQEAMEILSKVQKHTGFTGRPRNMQEKWKIYYAYLYYVFDSGWDNVFSDAYSGQFSKFRLNKFLNEIEIFTKDKQGLNVALLILKVLIYLNRREYDKIIDIKEAMYVYDKRHLTEKVHHRTHIFIKMLLMMQNADFDYEKTIKATHSYYDEIVNESSIDKGNQDGLEIIPFEQLWQQILTRLR